MDYPMTYPNEMPPEEDRMDLNVHFRRIPKSKAREICGDIAGVWDSRYYITISLTRSED